MVLSLRRAALALALLAVPAARAQQPPPSAPHTPAPRAPGQERPAAAGQTSAPAKPPAPSPAPRPPVQRDGASTPAARPPGTQPPAHHPAPAARTHTPHRPAGPAPAVVPAPAPTAEAPPVPPESRKGSNTGYPLPRFAALRSDEVNLRGGPGTRYPIAWVYKRRDLPVEIEREFDVWRLIRDPEGVKGWVHAAVLTGRRTLVVTGAERPVRREPNDAAATVARFKPGVIARLRRCEAGSDWCEVQKEDYRGWMKRGEFWGTYPGEAVQ